MFSNITLELPMINITKENSNHITFCKNKKFQFSGATITDKSDEFLLNQIYMQK